MWHTYVNEEMEKAYGGRDFSHIEVRLDEDADVTHKIGRDNGTLLHYCATAEDAKGLLLRGAHINARNIYNETPLHTAITLDKGLDLIRVFLEHGAEVNAIDCNGSTPLHRAVILEYSNKLDVIKELLEYGAVIDIKNGERQPLNNGSISLAKPQCRYDWPKLHLKMTVKSLNRRNLEWHKVLVKITILKNFGGDYSKTVELTSYTDYNVFCELSRFAKDCHLELIRMKNDMVHVNFSLYAFVFIENVNLQTFNKIADNIILANYPIYHDYIAANVNMYLTRANLLNTLSELHIYTGYNQKKVILNFDCASIIAMYLVNDELQNLVTAFDIHAEQSLDSSVNLVELSQCSDTELDEESASSCAKRARLE